MLVRSSGDVLFMLQLLSPHLGLELDVERVQTVVFPTIWLWLNVDASGELYYY